MPFITYSIAKYTYPFAAVRAWRLFYLEKPISMRLAIFSYGTEFYDFYAGLF
jgi:hypothetical protein